ncbi:MAG TPA: hypothetical protein DD435_04405 [Cyanobacteria bacterium UBA8530]|nr:hypothetical protein [Cyanobacteria bacterium UBA8530]
MTFQTGQRVTLDIGNYLFSGEITSLGDGEVQITCPIPLNFGQGNGKLMWPDGRTEVFNIGEVPHYSSLVLRLPLRKEERLEKIIGAANLRPAATKEYRRSVRIDCQISLRIQDLSDTFLIQAKTINLSGGGAQIVTEFPLIVGRDYCFVLEVEGDIPVKGKVLRKLPNQRYAIKFLTDAETGIQLMRRIFKSLQAHHHNQAKTPKKSNNFRRG